MILKDNLSDIQKDKNKLSEELPLVQLLSFIALLTFSCRLIFVLNYLTVLQNYDACNLNRITDY